MRIDTHLMQGFHAPVVHGIPDPMLLSSSSANVPRFRKLQVQTAWDIGSGHEIPDLCGPSDLNMFDHSSHLVFWVQALLFFEYNHIITRSIFVVEASHSIDQNIIFRIEPARNVVFSSKQAHCLVGGLEHV